MSVLSDCYPCFLVLFICMKGIFPTLYSQSASLVAQVKNWPANARDLGPIPGLGRSLGEGNSNPLQYSCLGNVIDREAWQTTVLGVAKSQTGLSN